MIMKQIHTTNYKLQIHLYQIDELWTLLSLCFWRFICWEFFL